MDADTLRDGIFALQTRRFGRVAEHMLQTLEELGAARGRFHDLFSELDQHRIEVKVSRVLAKNELPIEPGTLLAAIGGARVEHRMISTAEASASHWDCNIQQVKVAEFEVLYYGLFFSDEVTLFRVETADVASLPGYSNVQHKGNVGEGQFHIKPSNLPWHRENRLHASITYEELLDSLRRVDSVVG